MANVCLSLRSRRSLRTAVWIELGFFGAESIKCYPLLCDTALFGCFKKEHFSLKRRPELEFSRVTFMFFDIQNVST